jgi:hypothetical protein
MDKREQKKLLTEIMDTDAKDGLYEMTSRDDISYFLDKSGTIRKSIILYKMVGSVATPILYIQKPKYISEEEFKSTMNSIEIRIRQ